MTVTEIQALWKKASPMQPRDFLVSDMLKAEEQLKENACQFIGTLLEEIKNLKEELANKPDDDQVEMDFIKEYTKTTAKDMYEAKPYEWDIS